MRYGELISLLMVDLQAILRSHLKIEGATFQQVIAISVIPNIGIQMTGLSKKLGVDNSTATRLIDRLEKKEWIKKMFNQDDKRIVMVFLTEKGILIQKNIEIQFDEIGEKVEGLFNSKDGYEALECMRVLHWKLSKMLLS